MPNKVNGTQNGIMKNGGTNVTSPRGSMASTRVADATSIMTGKSSLSKMGLALNGCCSDDPRSPRGRKQQLVKVLGMASIPIIVLMCLSAKILADAILQQEYAQSFKKEVQFAVQAGEVVHALGLERGTTTFYVSMQNEALLPAALKRRKMVDESLRALKFWPDVKPEDNFFQQKADLQLQLAINRLTVNQSTPEAQLLFFTNIIASILNFIGDAVIESKAAEQNWQELAAYHLFVTGKEGTAAERSCGTILYGRGNMSRTIYLWYQEKKFSGEAFINRSFQYNPDILRQLRLLYYGTALQQNVTAERELINQNDLGQRDLERGRFWYALMSNYQNVLHDIEKTLTDNITAHLDLAIYHANQTVGLQIFVLVLAIILFPSIIWFLNHITSQIQNFASILHEKSEDIMKEKKRTEAVLKQLLPPKIAERIKNREVIVPESYDQVTIFFSDIVEFTVLSSQSTPLQIVDTLNRLYTTMDKKIEQYDVYKVETIGDAYLCASGLPERNGNRHSYEMASMALELINDVAQIRLPHKPDYALRMRIGLNTGPCAAGVIGTKMPRYCIFGDTVNTASRMESHGEALRIHITQNTYDALRYFNAFEMECRGVTEIKGKGLMTTYWLLKKTKEDKRNLFVD